MQKLTLSVDRRVVARARRYARARRTSISRLVEAYLDLLGRTSASTRQQEPRTPPVLSRLRGVLKSGSVDDYRQHLERKHR